jgi:cell division protein FtsI/penicillin-binding protein 2
MLLGVEDDSGARLRSTGAVVRSRLPVNPDHLAIVRSGMRALFGQGNTEYGTKYSGVARGAGVQAGKLSGLTATVEYARPDPRAEARTHGWFVGFAPSEDPRVAMAVFLRRGKGPEDAAVAAREIVARYLDAR